MTTFDDEFNDTKWLQSLQNWSQDETHRDRLNLRFSDLKDDACSSFIKCIEQDPFRNLLPSVKNLDLSGNSMTDIGCSLICTKLLNTEPSVKITRLDMSNNPIGDKGVRAVLHYANRTGTIEELYLTAVVLTDKAIPDIAKFVAFSKTLRKLSLRSNYISDVGLKDLTAALLSSTSLRNIDLLHNDISHPALTLLNTALRQSRPELALYDSCQGQELCCLM
eukprot:TRINITY_DN2428_c0_g2::TRINITY_DN2428_c0_g2_i1::g.8792::m.8792 TRINITY_DN2428_c0_g2::TRINITY_DN2428_c0_g2_i1::g.8792  ORF type:complete len:221 (-),score=7.73,sp/P10775/RINI_PIG/27.14/3e-09,sp/P10775/RINI_PIG/27.74/5e-07,LRR_6/PF13516.1/2.7e+02,LRR_6/PF13516.1/0.0055,LRR_6/PF13516.1/0.0046,LRR_6/PF13516.1/8.6e+03,LRR_6/PF13516.1/0.2,LRR_6/PF13516.1/3.9e+02,LRR_4/PF12799.2/0.15,LRR_4/PF12799.2/0.0039,LRR_4/PF12799.2/0.12,LRR_4/PF12799.2/0.0019,LRR_1/PF00560.28/5.4e+02,LRR_1/PF00560.28/0.24,LRR_1/P